ncbi:hypothetical protein CRUP_035730 [Coryphaenoides rupestris]|nr:hypothetical protein CRUP_035730 [Coryphaenoides rupestris]
MAVFRRVFADRYVWAGGGVGDFETPSSPSLKLSNGYVLPRGTLTPNTLFVGGIPSKTLRQLIQPPVFTVAGVFPNGAEVTPTLR